MIPALYPPRVMVMWWWINDKNDMFIFHERETKKNFWVPDGNRAHGFQDIYRLK